MPRVSVILHSGESGSDANPNVQLFIRLYVLHELNFKEKPYDELVN